MKDIIKLGWIKTEAKLQHFQALQYGLKNTFTDLEKVVLFYHLSKFGSENFRYNRPNKNKNAEFAEILNLSIRSITKCDPSKLDAQSLSNTIKAFGNLSKCYLLKQADKDTAANIIPKFCRILARKANNKHDVDNAPTAQNVANTILGIEYLVNRDLLSLKQKIIPSIDSLVQHLLYIVVSGKEDDKLNVATSLSLTIIGLWNLSKRTTLPTSIIENLSLLIARAYFLPEKAFNNNNILYILFGCMLLTQNKEEYFSAFFNKLSNVSSLTSSQRIQLDQLLGYCHYNLELDLNTKYYDIHSAVPKPEFGTLQKSVRDSFVVFLIKNDINNITIDTNCYEWGYFMDIVINIQNQKLKLVIEIDSHDKFRESLLKLAGYQAIHISRHEWNTSKDKFEIFINKFAPYIPAIQRIHRLYFVRKLPLNRRNLSRIKYQIEAGEFQKLLNNLNSNEFGVTDITTLFYHLTQQLRSEHWTSKEREQNGFFKATNSFAILHREAINLITLFKPEELNTQEISNTIFAFGILAKRGFLTAFNQQTENTIIVFARALPHKSPNAQNLANAILGLGNLADAGLLKNITCDTILNLIKQLSEMSLNGKDVEHAIIGLDNLRKNKNLIGLDQLAKSEINSAINKFLQKKSALQIHTREAAEIILSLGNLATDGFLTSLSKDALSSIYKLTEDMNDKWLKMEDVDNASLGIKSLSKHGLLADSDMDIQRLIEILEKRLKQVSKKKQDTEIENRSSFTNNLFGNSNGRRKKLKYNKKLHLDFNTNGGGGHNFR